MKKETKLLVNYQLWEDDYNVKKDLEKLREREIEIIKKYLKEK